MSVHPSLRKPRGKLGTARNVLKRYERLQHLMKRGLWTEGRSVLGLPKIKPEKIKVSKAAPKEATATAKESAAASPAKGTPSGSGPAS